MEIEYTYSETMSCRKKPLQNQLKPLKRFKPFKSWIWLLPICVFILMVMGCDTDQILTPPVRHTVEISELSLENQTLDPGGTTAVTATFGYSGDEADLIFRWEASNGQIVGEASSVTYVASEVPGTHTITLELTDGFEMVDHSITVEVIVPQSLLIDFDTYWAARGETFVLKYQVSITQVLRQTVTLRYAIIQDEARTGAFLNVEADGVLLVEEEAIGEVDPVERVVITGEVDVSRVITGSGMYEITLTLAVANPVERGWLLQKVELIGAKGSAVQL